MSENKTKQTGTDPKDFLKSIENESMRKDSEMLLEIMGEITNEKPKMWGSSIIGFGKYHYKYESGREGDFFLVGFSPRKQAISLYINGDFDGYDALMADLGKYKKGASCIYIKKLDDVDVPTLKKLVKKSAERLINT